MSFAVHTRIPSLRRLCSLLPVAILLMAAGCTSLPAMNADDITVEGQVTVRGNVPFHETVLVTAQDTWYLLDMDPALREGFMTPARIRVTGPVRLGEWNGRPFTRLTVRTLEILGEED